MSYAPRRPRVSKKLREAVLAKTDGCCYLCLKPITGSFDVDHEIARELGGSDSIENLLPAHRECHRTKSKQDVAAIAHSNRLRRKHGLDPDNRKPRPVMRGRGFQERTTPTSWPKRPFPQRRTT